MCFFDENQICLKAAAAEKIINGCMWWRAADIWILFTFHGPVAFIKTSHSTFSAHWFPFCLLTFFLKRVQEQKAKGCSRLVSLRGTYTFHSFHSWHDTLFPFFLHEFFYFSKIFWWGRDLKNNKTFLSNTDCSQRSYFSLNKHKCISIHTVEKYMWPTYWFGTGTHHDTQLPFDMWHIQRFILYRFKSCAVVLLPAFLFFFNFF